VQLKIDCARDCSSSCKCDVHFRESGCTCGRDCTANKKDQLRQSVWVDLFLYLIIGISVASAANLPKQFQEYSEEISKVFNGNVSFTATVAFKADFVRFFVFH